ncbi:MAG: DUF1697 domain-containing protein [Rhodothermia bacterium]|nr:DUF1697 domain-containing protein [Rhodothermia bacterium]
MPQYVALLRGINVGGHRVRMERLRELFEEAGLKDVSTHIASGNVIFTSRSTSINSLTSKIERHLARSLGYDVPTFLRTPPELEAVTTFPLPVAPGSPSSTFSQYVIFLRSPASKELQDTFAGLHSEMDTFLFSEREIYWLIRGKLSQSPLFRSGFEKAIRGIPNTTRNMNMLRRLVARLMDESSPS